MIKFDDKHNGMPSNVVLNEKGRNKHMIIKNKNLIIITIKCIFNIYKRGHQRILSFLDKEFLIKKRD